MAPEQLRALAASPADWPPPVDERSDVFSLGVILYELLTGSLPFGSIQTNLPRDEISARLLERQERGPAALREANRDVDAPLAELVESCLAVEPADRPQTAEELAAALRQHGSPLPRARRWTRRNALFLGLCAAFLLAIASVPAYRWWTFDPFLAGMEHLKLEQYAKAEQRFTEAIASNPDSSDYYYWRARSRQLRGHYRDAAEDYKLAATDYRLAAEDYKLAAQYDPAREYDCFASAAYCHAMHGAEPSCVANSIKVIEAAEAIDDGRAIEDGCLAAVYNNLGHAYRMESVYGHSLDTLDKAIALDPDLGPAYHNRARAFLRQTDDGRPVDPQALADIDKAIAIGPPSPWLHFDAAQIHYYFERRSGKAPEQTTYHAKEALRLGVDPKKVCQAFPFLCEDSRPGDVSARSGYVPFRQRMEILLVDPFPHHSLDAR
jgi:tetratricopeptide (TPR) repeat protein